LNYHQSIGGLNHTFREQEIEFDEQRKEAVIGSQARELVDRVRLRVDTCITKAAMQACEYNVLMNGVPSFDLLSVADKVPNLDFRGWARKRDLDQKPFSNSALHPPGPLSLDSSSKPNVMTTLSAPHGMFLEDDGFGGSALPSLLALQIRGLFDDEIHVSHGTFLIECLHLHCLNSLNCRKESSKPVRCSPKHFTPAVGHFERISSRGPASSLMDKPITVCGSPLVRM